MLLTLNKLYRHEYNYNFVDPEQRKIGPIYILYRQYSFLIIQMSHIDKFYIR